VYHEEIDQAKLAVRDHLEAHPEIEQDLFIGARIDALRAERAAITSAMRRDLISYELHDELSKEADEHLAAITVIKEQLSARPSPEAPRTTDFSAEEENNE
jgi:hypothetical protein